MTDLEYVEYETDAPVEGAATVTMNRPEKRNAMNSQLRDEIYEAMRTAVTDDDVRCIVLAGAGDAFSAGGDLESYSRQGPLDTLDANTYDGTHLYQWIAKCPKPTVAAMDGYAFGGGALIALSFDFRIASSRTVLGYTEIKVGLFPMTAAHQLVHMVGTTKTKDLLLRGQTFSAEEGEAWGIINEVHPEGEAFEAGVAALASELVALPPVAYRFGKRAINRTLVNDAGYEPLGYERLAISLLFGTEDQKEGARAFLEDREPEFSGR